MNSPLQRVMPCRALWYNPHSMDPRDKEKELIGRIGSFNSLIVAFSGGVDSSYLAYMCNEVLGGRSIAVTAISPAVSEMQESLARRFASEHALNHRLVRTDEMEDENYRSNPSNRCYFCKSELYEALGRLRERWEVEAIADGSNLDDAGDYRPGGQAASENDVRSPLAEVGLGKAEIRTLSRQRGLSTWDLPAMPCLSSRFPYGVRITAEKLRQVEEAEAFLREMGLRNFRVRHHEEIARIEVATEEMADLLTLERFDRIQNRLRQLGYQFVTLDLRGFESGSLNRLLEIET